MLHAHDIAGDVCASGVREATHADVGTIALLGARFFEEAGWSDVTSWDHDSVCATLHHLIDGSDGILLVAEDREAIVGMIGGLVYPAYYNSKHLIGQELFWWVEPAHRGKWGGVLLDELEACGRNLGAASFMMASLAKVNPLAMARIYARRGYRPSENTFVKAMVA